MWIQTQWEQHRVLRRRMVSFASDSAGIGQGVGCTHSLTPCSQPKFSVEGHCIQGVIPTNDGRCGVSPKNTTCAGSLNWSGQCCSAGGYWYIFPASASASASASGG